jgi:hypothetical protein
MTAVASVFGFCLSEIGFRASKTTAERIAFNCAVEGDSFLRAAGRKLKRGAQTAAMNIPSRNNAKAERSRKKGD